MHPTDFAIQKRFNFRGRNRNLPWYPRHGKRVHLAELFATLGFRDGIEVGTRRGAFAKVLCEANPVLYLTCVDPWVAYGGHTQEAQDANFAEAQRVLAEYNVKYDRRPSLKAVWDYEYGSFDFVNIDGNHSFEDAVQDIIHWSKRVKVGGIIMVHDFNPFCGYDVPLAVDAYTRANHVDPWYVTREMEPTAFWVQTVSYKTPRVKLPITAGHTPLPSKR